MILVKFLDNKLNVMKKLIVGPFCYLVILEIEPYNLFEDEC